jgi:hypothetical protein
MIYVSCGPRADSLTPIRYAIWLTVRQTTMIAMPGRKPNPCFCNRVAETIASTNVAWLVGIEGGVVSGVINLESPGVEAPGRRPRHEECYQQA